DTHGPEPTVIVGCFWGHAYQWRRFETKLRRIQRREGFRIFHAKDFKAHAGEFKGWDDDRCYRLATDLSNLVGNTLAEGVVIALERQSYLSEYRSVAHPKMHLDSQLGVCFRSCLVHIIRQVARMGRKPKLNVVVESGHANAWDNDRIFHEIKSRLERRGIFVLEDITIASKEEAPPLMAADFLASTYSMIRKHSPEALAAPTQNDYSNALVIPHGHRRGLNAIGIEADGLADFISQAKAFRWERRTDRRRSS
ncbi:MAG TPA: hypothetical protein VJV39_00990, partial [Dongiaceae bacterium]|nr:hypothetical protein [Dongiaceae bacterium]